MRKVWAFLVWLFSFWTWKEFLLRRLWRPPFYCASGETAGSEHLRSQEGPPESEWARSLASLPEDGRWCRRLEIYGYSTFKLIFRPNGKAYHADLQAGYREFLGAVASSEVVFHEEMRVHLVSEDSLKHIEAFADALRRSGNAFKKLQLHCWRVSAIPFAKCVVSVLLGNDAIQDLDLVLKGLNEKMGKEVAAEFMAIVGVPHILKILKSFEFDSRDLDDEGMEQLMKPFNNPQSALEELEIGPVTSDVQLQHISGLLATTTSLKRLLVNYVDKRIDSFDCTRGYTKMASALCSNRSLQYLECGISSSMELKALLDPLMPKSNNLQSNTTLTHLRLHRSVGGKEGVETLAYMLCTNTSLVELTFFDLHEFRIEDAEAIENILAILGALKTNKYLKTIGFISCSAVGGYKVLGAMMDLLLENHCIEDIRVWFTPLEESGDEEYVYSALTKRKKMKLWGIIQGMANVKPTSGRVFLCGEPFAGTICIFKFCL